MAILSAATLFGAISGTAGYASPGAAPGAARPAANCVPMDDGSCMRFSAVTETTTVFVTATKSGDLRGFSDFSSYAAFIGNEFNVTIKRGGNGITISPGKPKPPDCKEGDDNCPGSDEGDRTGNAPRSLSAAHAMANFATFYDSGLMTGPAFALNPPNVIANLATLPKPGGGTWNNRISAVITTGGPSLMLGAGLCSQPSCIGGWWLTVLNNSQTQLLGGFNNTASLVAVF
ncbi:hypothetical protein KZ829_41670 [Actinoplanes hulinensis]|uniref:Uncharacterized protein n=1 Tax=Actinoplanes hulinensis TaxID=1144547 RepID=A0ABS7BH97_9ACTN|nr:hypothetical protein [Actinoplanes hulinensis]MBW6440251.1 hypothetical protein [Actinoplanes hulinensis]